VDKCLQRHIFNQIKLFDIIHSKNQEIADSIRICFIPIDNFSRTVSKGVREFIGESLDYPHFSYTLTSRQIALGMTHQLTEEIGQGQIED